MVDDEGQQQEPVQIIVSPREVVFSIFFTAYLSGFAARFSSVSRTAKITWRKSIAPMKSRNAHTKGPDRGASPRRR